MNIYFDPQYNATTVAFETTRKATDVAQSLRRRPVTGTTVVAPSAEMIAGAATALPLLHNPAYIDALKTGEPRRLAASNGIGWDDQLFGAVTASSAGVVAAAFDAMEHGTAGSLSSGLHHARYNYGNGFCTVNGLALAAKAVCEAVPNERVVIVDLDAHCGGGTANLLYANDLDRVSQFDLSVSPFDCDYKTAPDRVRRIVRNPAAYLTEVEELLAGVPTDKVAVVLYNAGMDPHEEAGGLYGIDAEMLRERERMVFRWAEEAGLGIAFVLAGGYTIGLTMDELVGLHRFTVEEAAAVQP